MLRDLNPTKQRALTQSRANTETLDATVQRTYTDAVGNVTSADVLPVGYSYNLERVPNGSGARLWVGAAVLLAFQRGGRFTPSILSLADGAGGAVAASNASTLSPGLTESTTDDADLSGIPFLLESDSTDAPDGYTLVPGANVYFTSNPPTDTSGGTQNGRFTITAVPVVATSLPDPVSSGYPHSTCLDLVDSYSNPLGMYRLDLAAGTWRRRDSSGGGGGTVVPISLGGTGQTTSLLALAALGGEPALGNPGTNGYLLSSTTLGVRSWVAPGAAFTGSTNQTLRFSGTDTLTATGLLSVTTSRVGINLTTPSYSLLELNDNGASLNGTVLAINGTTAMGTTSGAGVGVGLNNTPNAANIRLGYHYYHGRLSAGGAFGNTVQLEAFSGESWVSGSTLGSYFTVKITPNGGSTQAEMLRVDGVGVGIKNTVPNSVLSIGGSVSYASRTVTSGSVTLDATDYYVRASGGVTITLPTAVLITGRVYLIKMIGAGTVTINTTSSQTIDGSVGTTITTTNGVKRFISNGSNWDEI